MPEDPFDEPTPAPQNEASPTTKSKAMSFVGKLFNKSSPTTPRQEEDSFESPKETSPRPLGGSRKKPLMQSSSPLSPASPSETGSPQSTTTDLSQSEGERSRSYLDTGRRHSRSRSSSPSLKVCKKKSH